MENTINLNAFVKDLEQLTNIDSGTGNTQGSKQIAEIIKSKLESQGGSVEIRTNEKGSHVIARFKGNGKLRLLMLAHTDTVFANGEAAKRPFKKNAELKAYGPGVGDDKASVVLTIHVMQALKAQEFEEYGEIVIYYNAEEETGSTLAEGIITELAKNADSCIVMDTAREGWGIVSKRKGEADYKIEVSGIKGHAGNSPHYGASAVNELVNQITLLNKLVEFPPHYNERRQDDHGQYIPESTINVGVIGTNNDKVNVISDNAYALLEVRCFQKKELERIDAEIKKLPQKISVPGTNVVITGGIKSDPMEKDEKVQKLVDLYKDIVKKEYKAEVVEWMAGGVADGNIASRFTPTIDALGVDTYYEHTEKEYADLNTVEPRGKALIRLIQSLTERWPNL